MVFQDEAVILNTAPDYRCVLFQNAEQRRGEDDALLPMPSGVGESEPQTGQGFAAAGWYMETEHAAGLFRRLPALVRDLTAGLIDGSF